MNALDLMRLHVEAAFGVNHIGDLASDAGPDRPPTPRFFLGSTVDGHALWFRDDVPEAVRHSVQHLCEGLPVPSDLADTNVDPAPFEAVLNAAAPVQNTWTGPAYVVPPEVGAPSDALLIREAESPVLRPRFEDWLGDVHACQPFAVALDQGAAVSLCASVRITPEAHEAGVETHPDFRGRGFAGLVVATWADSVWRLGSVPLYSTSWQNTASRAVARKLGLVQFGTDLHIT